jgi:hypothetical protein
MNNFYKTNYKFSYKLRFKLLTIGFNLVDESLKKSNCFNLLPEVSIMFKGAMLQ